MTTSFRDVVETCHHDFIACFIWDLFETLWLGIFDRSLQCSFATSRLNNYCPNISIETMFMNTKNSKMNEPPKLVLNLSQSLDLISPNMHLALQNLYIYYTWKSIRKQCKNNSSNVELWIWISRWFLFCFRYSLKSMKY